jgi:integrase
LDDSSTDTNCRAGVPCFRATSGRAFLSGKLIPDPLQRKNVNSWKPFAATNLSLAPMPVSWRDTGLRKTEGLLLKWEFINLDSGMLTVEASKNYKKRHVPLSGFAIEFFKGFHG